MSCSKIHKQLWRILFVLVCLVPFTAFGQTIRIVTEEWKPYNYTHQGVLVGSSTEILREALALTDLKYTIQSYPWARAYILAQQNPNTLIYSISRTTAREKLFKWVAEIAPPIKFYLYKTSARKEIIATNIEEAKSYKVGVIRSSNLENTLKDLGFEEDTNLFLVSDDQQGINMLIHNRLDFFAGEEKNIQAKLEEWNFDQSRITPSILLNEEKIYAAFHRETDDKTVNTLRNAIETVYSANDKNTLPQTD